MSKFKLQNGDILVFKRSRYSFSSFNDIVESVIQFGTRCRYFHTGTYYKNRLYQSTYSTGVQKPLIRRVVIDEMIENNEIDVFRQDYFNKTLFESRVNEALGMGYDFGGILSTAFDSLFNTSPFDLQSKNRYFCSELTSHIHNLKIDKKRALTTPCDIAHSNELTRVT